MKIDLGITEIREIIRNGGRGVSRDNFKNLKTVFVDSFREYDGKYVLFRNVQNGNRQVGVIYCDEGDTGMVVTVWNHQGVKNNFYQLYDIEVVEVLRVVREDEEEHPEPTYEFPPIDKILGETISPQSLLAGAWETVRNYPASAGPALDYLGVLCGVQHLTAEIMTEEMVDDLDHQAQVMVYANTIWYWRTQSEYKSAVTGEVGKQALYADLISSIFMEDK